MFSANSFEREISVERVKRGEKLTVDIYYRLRETAFVAVNFTVVEEKHGFAVPFCRDIKLGFYPPVAFALYLRFLFERYP